uniref:MADS-box transcription factor 34 n=1 Tax=Talaromyces marneffei PM1 TaxID=1077442 RepID=A0A093UMR3_TALMA
MVDTVEDICREKQLHKPQMSQDSLQRRQKQQQRNRRGNALIKKAYELSDIADADVFLDLRS